MKKTGRKPKAMKEADKMTYREALKEWNNEIMGEKIYGIPRKGHIPYAQVQDLRKTGHIDHYDPKPIRFMMIPVVAKKPVVHTASGYIPTAEMAKEIVKPTVASVAKRKRPTIAVEEVKPVVEEVKPVVRRKRPTIAVEEKEEVKPVVRRKRPTIAVEEKEEVKPVVRRKRPTIVIEEEAKPVIAKSSKDVF